MIKIDFKNGKNFQKKLEKSSSSLSKAKGEILESQEMLPKTEVADSSLKALYDALYKAKLENDMGKMQIILEEIEKVSNSSLSDIKRELASRKINEFVKSLVE